MIRALQAHPLRRRNPRVPLQKRVSELEQIRCFVKMSFVISLFSGCLPELCSPVLLRELGSQMFSTQCIADLA